MRVFEGKLISEGERYAIIVSRFNEFINSKLLSGAVDGLTRHGVKDENVDVYWVPGAFEMPLVAKKLSNSGKYDAVICLGTVIRGSTTHYELVSAEVAKGIAQVSLASGIPVIFGVLATENIEQAIERAGTKVGNKGYDAALSAIEMTGLLNNIT